MLDGFSDALPERRNQRTEFDKIESDGIVLADRRFENGYWFDGVVDVAAKEFQGKRAMCKVLTSFEPATAGKAGFEEVGGMKIGKDVEKDLIANREYLN